MAKALAKQQINTIYTQFFNLDNGNGTTVDEPVLYAHKGGRIVRIYALYGEATQTVAAGNFRVGSAVGGSQYVASTAYENTKSVGDATNGTLVTDVIPAGGTLFVRHTGVASTQTGTAKIMVDWVEND